MSIQPGLRSSKKCLLVLRISTRTNNGSGVFSVAGPPPRIHYMHQHEHKHLLRESENLKKSIFHLFCSGFPP